MSHSCAPWRGEIGAYVVGALDNPARDRVTRHLVACAGCRADYGELVPVREMLGMLDLNAAEPERGHAGQPAHRLHDPCLDGPADAAGEAPVARPYRGSGTQSRAKPAASLRWSRPRTRRWMPASAAALAALGALATVVAVLVSSAAPARMFRAADSATGVSGRAQLHDTPAGTQINLTASGLPRDERCILVAVTRRGTDIAGSWSATYDGLAGIAGMTAFPASRLTALRIESDTGKLLLSIRV